jgi:hypothetical protein
VKRRHETAVKNRGRPKNIYSDNFHVELLCFTRLLNKGLHISVRFCYFKADAGVRSGWVSSQRQPGAGGDGFYGSFIRS